MVFALSQLRAFATAMISIVRLLVVAVKAQRTSLTVLTFEMTVKAWHTSCPDFHILEKGAIRHNG